MVIKPFDINRKPHSLVKNYLKIVQFHGEIGKVSHKKAFIPEEHVQVL